MKDFIRSVMAVAFLMLMAGIAFGGYTFYDAYQAKRIFAPAPPPTAHEIQIAAFNAWVWFGVKAGLQVATVLGLYWSALRFLWVPMVKAREEIHYSPDTGMLPLVRRNVAPLYKRIFGHNEYDEADGNLAVAAHRKIYSNGTLKVVSDTGGLDPMSQADYARASWGVQGSIARKGRGISVGEQKLLSGEAGANARLAHAKADAGEVKLRMLEERSMQTYTSDAPLIEMTPNPTLSIEMALGRSEPGRIEIGQAETGMRQTAMVEFDVMPFFLVAGRTRMGKTTSVAFELVLACLYWGWPVTVFEPPEKRDWRTHFGSHINHHTIDADNALDHMGMVLKEYERRAYDMEMENVRNWQDAPDRFPPWVLVIEEFGALRETFLLEENEKEGKDNLRRFDAATKILVKRAANSGLIIIAVDQYPEKYLPAIRGAFTKAAFYMGGQGLGNIVDSPKNHRINGTRGIFDRGDIDENENPIFYKALHAEAELRSFLPRIPVPKPLALLSHESCKGRVKVSERPNERTSERPANGQRMANATNETITRDECTNGVRRGGGKAGEIVIPPSALRAFASIRTWDSLAMETFKKLPNTTQAELRRMMCKVDSEDRDAKSFNGEAFDLFHAYSPHGDRSKTKRIPAEAN